MSTMINPKYEGDKVAYLANDFVRYSTALQPLDEFEINFFIYLCYKAKEYINRETGEGWDALIDIDMQKFLQGIDYKKPWSKYNREEKNEIYTKLKKLKKKDFEIRTDKYKKIINDVKGAVPYEYRSFGYITHIRYVPETWTMEVRMDKDTQEFLCKYEQGDFTPIVFKNIVSLKKKYAKMLYMYFRSYRDGNIKGTSYTIEHLKSLLGLEDKYPNWYNFKRYILLPAIEEINEKSDIFVFGNRNIISNLLEDRKLEDLTEKERAKIILESMCIKADKGKSIYKIQFHVEKNEGNLDEMVFKKG